MSPLAASQAAASAAPHSEPGASEDLVLLVLSPNIEKSLRVLGELRSGSTARVIAIGPVIDSKFVLRVMRMRASRADPA